MSKFRNFFEKTTAPASYGRPIDWKPSTTSARTVGGDPGLGQLGKPPVGGWTSLQHWAQWRKEQQKHKRIFDLRKLAQAVGVDVTKSEEFIKRYSSNIGGALTYYAAESFLRDLKQRTDSARFVLAEAGTTPNDPDLSARIKGAHFRNQGMNQNGTEQIGADKVNPIDQNFIEDLDKRLYTGEVSGRGGGVGAFELGTALSCITPAGKREKNYGRPDGLPGRYDINIPLMEKIMSEFSQMESTFTRGLEWGVLGAGILGKAGHKMLQPSTGIQAGHSTDAFSPGASAF